MNEVPSIQEITFEEKPSDWLLANLQYIEDNPGASKNDSGKTLEIFIKNLFSYKFSDSEIKYCDSYFFDMQIDVLLDVISPELREDLGRRIFVECKDYHVDKRVNSSVAYSLLGKMYIRHKLGCKTGIIIAPQGFCTSLKEIQKMLVRADYSIVMIGLDEIRNLIQSDDPVNYFKKIFLDHANNGDIKYENGVLYDKEKE